MCTEKVHTKIYLATTFEVKYFLHLAMEKTLRDVRVWYWNLIRNVVIPSDFDSQMSDDAIMHVYLLKFVFKTENIGEFVN